MKKIILGVLTVFTAVLFSCEEKGENTRNLAQEFMAPPASAKPKTWFHAMSGNMTKEGLTKDLESMAEVGLGGLLLFNVTQGIPNGPIKYNSPQHHEMIAHAAKEAERLGLSFGVHNCDGWSASGGPWVLPEESMKMVVWSETVTEGGVIHLPLKEPTKREGFYQDIAVLAYPALDSEIDDTTNTPVITASDTLLDTALICDGKIDAESTLTAQKNEFPWIQFTYQKPKTIRSANIIFNDRHSTAILQTSKDGKKFTDVRDLYKVRTGKGEWAINDHFEGVTSTYFRLKFNRSTTLKEVQLTANYYINNALGRTAIARTEDKNLAVIGSPDSTMLIDPWQIRNLSDQMDAQGVLKTKLPSGNWTIIRFGYTSTGAFNNPASDEGRGLEVDKLSRPPFKKHYDAFIKKVVNKAGPVAPNALQYIEIDSYEMGGQNWTDDFAKIFEDEKGYDFIEMLPLVAGRFIGNAASSEAVLSDYRKVISDLMTKNYFEYFTELCNADGLKSYIEPYGFGPLNDLDIGGVTDIPMGEFWMNRPITQTESAVSGAHIYGKPVISAESFTSTPQINWKGHPAMAKTSGDLGWTYGINEFMFHRFAHQANPNVAPGMTMNRWGFHLDRTQTWWKNAGKAWFKYIARGSHMLRQGVPVSDVLIFVGEGAPNSAYYRDDISPAIPKSINFDNVNTDVLLNRIAIEDKELVLPEGTSYKILLLQNSKTISLETAKRILAIAKSGVPVYGAVPENLAGYKNPEEELKAFDLIVSELKPLIKKLSDWEKVFTDYNLTPDMQFLNQETTDYAHRKTATEDIYFFFNPDTLETKTFHARFRVGNKIPELWNPMDGSITKQGLFTTENGNTTTQIRLDAGASIFVVFREDADTIHSAKEHKEHLHLKLSEKNMLKATVLENGSYSVPLTSRENWDFTVTDIPASQDISTNWQVTFKKEEGYGGTVSFDSLVDWSAHPKDSINYYSGTASYTKTIVLNEEETKKDTRIALDLGQVYIVGEVLINGKPVTVSWMPPFQVDITDYVKNGENQLAVLLTNQWSNRLIGDERYPANDGGYKLGPHRATDLTMPEWYTNNEPRPKGKRTTFTTAPFYKANDALMPSGLLGPVQLHFSKTITHK
ncbi:glycosyl hydrolase [Maribacter chungangensis]|uniref:Glycosyl hydrolase n=1 Tax=Maribacter chungangensis TaxID=1069117 RepID=A0ABW3AZT6_9FLAO